jgi:hypothetical protein
MLKIYSCVNCAIRKHDLNSLFLTVLDEKVFIVQELQTREKGTRRKIIWSKGVIDNISSALLSCLRSALGILINSL